MKFIARTVAYLSLIILTVPPVLYLVGKMTLPQAKTGMLVATILWFLSAPWFMWEDQE